jgi:hypothetical protein
MAEAWKMGGSMPTCGLEQPNTSEQWSKYGDDCYCEIVVDPAAEAPAAH